MRPLRPLHGLVALGLLAAGCFHVAPPSDDGVGPLLGGLTNPYSFALGFEGERAYDHVLAQLYTDPEARTGPLYRVPGTPDSLLVAERLASLGATAGYRIEWLNFTGAEYYALDAGGVAGWQCTGSTGAADDRERVEGLTFRNLLLEPSGNASGLLLLAHWDTKRFAAYGPGARSEPIPGANDGASGVAVLLELARLVPDAGHRFLFVDGEDGFEDCHPLAGSIHFARTQAQGRGVEAALLLDMVGDPEALYTKESNSRGLPGGRGIQDGLWEVAAAMNASNWVARVTAGVIDDHLPFIDEGIPAVDVIDWDPDRAEGQGPFPPYWHTTGDDADEVTPEGLARSGLVVEAYLRLDRWRADAGLSDEGVAGLGG